MDVWSLMSQGYKIMMIILIHCVDNKLLKVKDIVMSCQLLLVIHSTLHIDIKDIYQFMFIPV